MTDPEDRARFAKVMAVLGEVFLQPGHQISEVQANAYFATLHDWPITVFERASELALRTCRFLPKPAELRELIEGTSDEQAQRAWEQIKAAARQVGGYASVFCEAHATASAFMAVFGSWVGFCDAELSPEMWASKRKEFLLAWRSAQLRILSPAARYFPGRCEIANRLQTAWLADGVQVQELHGVLGILRLDGSVERVPATASVRGELVGPIRERLGLMSSDRLQLPTAAPDAPVEVQTLIARLRAFVTGHRPAEGA